MHAEPIFRAGLPMKQWILLLWPNVAILFVWITMVTVWGSATRIARFSTMNYSTVVDQSDYSISTILYNSKNYSQNIWSQII